MTDNIWHPHADAVEWINAGGKVMTASGCPPEILSTGGRGSRPIIGYVDSGDWPTSWGVGGRHGSAHLRSPWDLIPAPRRHTRWVNFYQGGTWHAHPTKADADLAADRTTRIACVEITFTGEEGL